MTTFEQLAKRHTTYKDDIEVGKATIVAIHVRSTQETIWVLPGGERTTDRERAHEAAVIVNQLMKAKAA